MAEAKKEVKADKEGSTKKSIACSKNEPKKAWKLGSRSYASERAYNKFKQEIPCRVMAKKMVPTSVL